MAFTSRVGLGSPHLDFRPQWAPSRRRDSEDFNVVQAPELTTFEALSSAPSERSERSSMASSPGKTGSVFDKASGLPSPPRSNSDIALPSMPDTSLMNESPPASFIESSRRPLNGRTISMTSSASGSGLSEKSRRSVRPLSRATGMSRTSSSSSALASSPLRPQGSSADHGTRAPSISSSPRKDSRETGHQAAPPSSQSSRHSLIRSSGHRSSTSSVSSRLERSPSIAAASPSPSSSSPSKRAVARMESPVASPSFSAAASGSSSSRLSQKSRPRSSVSSVRSGHQLSPSALHLSSPAPSLPRQDRRSRLSPIATSPVIQEAVRSDRPEPKRYDSGRELDGRIKDAEDKIRSAARRPRHYPSTSPTKAPLHRHDSYTRLSNTRKEQRMGDQDNQEIPIGRKESGSPSPPALEPSPRTFTRAKGSRISRHLQDEEPQSPISRGSLSPEDSILARPQETYTRTRGASVAQQVHSGLETLRRSATVSSAASLARTPGGTDRDYGREEEQDRSGGSGGSRSRKPLPTSFRHAHNSLFTPSPKQPINDTHYHMHQNSPTSRFHTTSRLSREPSLPSPSSPRHRLVDGLERSSSVSSRLDRRNWAESVSGLPKRYNEMLDDHSAVPGRGDIPGDRLRAESVMDGGYVNRRYTRDRDLAPRFSRLSIAPSDSISAVGDSRHTASSAKDPLEVLRRIEAQRDQHNKQWDAERAASVLGDHPLVRPGSGSQIHTSPHRVRPATSMSALRDPHTAPRTAPLDRVRRSIDDLSSPHSSALDRSPSRLSRLGGPSTEPRPMRSSTSLGGRTSASLDVHTASSEHGKLLYEAARSFELKIPPEALAHLPDIVRAIATTARSAENSNAVTRSAIQLASQLNVDAELDDDPGKLLRDLKTLLATLRDAGRASDQNVRDLTRLMLEVPKLLRDSPGMTMSRVPTSATTGSLRLHPNGTNAAEYSSRRYPTSPYESPIRRSEDLPRSSTSSGDLLSPERRRQRESLPANFGSDGNGEGRGGRGFLSRMRDLGRSREGLDTIEDSPPKAFTVTTPQVVVSPGRLPLRKKASTTSTHTVRGNSFLPSASKATAAVSTVTAGESPRETKFDSPSLRSTLSGKRESGEWDFRGGLASAGLVDGGESSANSRFSFHTAEDASPGRGEVNESGDEGRGRASGEEELLSGLVEAQKKREAEGEVEGGKTTGLLGKAGLTRTSSVISKASTSGGRKWSVSDRFKATLGRKS